MPRRGGVVGMSLLLGCVCFLAGLIYMPAGSSSMALAHSPLGLGQLRQRDPESNPALGKKEEYKIINEILSPLFYQLLDKKYI